MSYPCASTNVRYSSAERLGARDLQGVGIGKELRPEILRLAVREALGAIALALDLALSTSAIRSSVDGSSPAETRTS